ncbi:MAG TPA: class I SAM-dependent methyltransferase [Candidatus Cybelea sp.]|nr:class I SAM-dependent methyltransferase [Candidatus Cybelea sp.]
MASWLEFWNQPHSIYVSRRHLEAHYRRIGDDVLALLPKRPLDLLDWGCGPALAAPVLARAGIRVALYDRARNTQAELRRQFANDRGIAILDDASYAALADASFDAVLVNSVIQYLERDELAARLAEWRRLLRPGGSLFIGDVIPPDAGIFADAASLLRSAAAHGFLLQALAGLGRTLVSDYRRIRGELGLRTYTAEAMLELLKTAGFAAERLPRNIGFAPHRMTFRAMR